jgi:dipeptidyl aminopeptidase/acylaminoacyl peptidase
MNADGTGQTQITNDSFDNHDPAWSPDGNYIAYVSDHSGISELCIIRPDGTGRTRVNSVAELVKTPAWRPISGVTPGGLTPPTIPPTTTPPPGTNTPPPTTTATTGRLNISISGVGSPYSIYVNGNLVGKDAVTLTLAPGSYRVTIYNRSGEVVKDETSVVIAGKDSVFTVSGSTK